MRFYDGVVISDATRGGHVGMCYRVVNKQFLFPVGLVVYFNGCMYI